MTETSKDPAAVSLGRRGGKARAENMTPEELSAQNSKAAHARWEKHRQEKEKAEKAGKKRKAK